MSCGVDRKRGSDLALLWLTAAAPIRPLAWKLPYILSAALKKSKNKNKTIEDVLTPPLWLFLYAFQIFRVRLDHFYQKKNSIFVSSFKVILFLFFFFFFLVFF